MDLHTIVKNLHTGKKSISHKNFSTILNISEVELNDSKIVGDYYSNLALLKSLIPNNIAKEGFILTHQGLLVLLQENSLLKNLTNVLKKSNLKNIDETSKSLKQIIQSITFSELLQVQLLKAYHTLQEQYPNMILRTKISFSHNNNEKFEQLQEEFFYVSNEEDLFKSIISSLLFFYNRDNLYSRMLEEIDENEISLAIGFEVVNQVNVSGICSSLDFKSGHTSLIQIQSGFGDEVYNRVHLSSTDSFQIFKKGFEEGFKAILPPQIATKKHALSLKKLDFTKSTSNSSNTSANSSLVMQVGEVAKKNQQIQSIDENQIKEIASLLLNVERLLQKHFKKYTPIELNFAILSNKESKKKSQIIIEDMLFEKKHTHLLQKEIKSYELVSSQSVAIARGIAIGNCITHGFVKHITKESDLYTITNEDIVIAHSTFPHWEPYLKNAKGLVIEQGSELSHSAQICYEHNIAAIINTGVLKDKLKNKSVVTLDCSLEEGTLYSGLEKYSIKMLNNDYINTDKESNFKKPTSLNIAQLTNNHNVLEKTHLPYNSQIIENVFDLVSKKHYSYKLHANYSKYFAMIKDEIIRQLSKIAIARYPQNVWINIASFSPTYYEIISNREDTYFKNSNVEGILRTLEPSFESHIEYILSILKYLHSNIGCENVFLYVDKVQQKKEVKQLKGILQKYNYRSNLGGVVNVGGILNIDELIEEFDMLAGDLNAIKLSCGKNNKDAIIKLSRYFVQRGEELNKTKNNNYNNNLQIKSSNKKINSHQPTQLALFNVNINDVDILDALKSNALGLISCTDNDIIPLYSYLIEQVKHKKVKDSKFVKRIEFN